MASFDSTSAGVATDPSAVVPAQLGFLAIYNPSLGTTDETLEDQIVYFASAPKPTSGSSSKGPDEERNERLRQIGLAQGMVAFGRSFAGDQSVDTIETDKSRVILHELEPSWWILASIDLTRLPTPSAEPEYSSREVKPAALLLQDILRAHSIFLLHHNISLQALFSSCPLRSRFTGLLSRYWDVFLSSWSVLLHGNPVRDVLPGLRMAACGELGVGVGEEERGSGEREVLEGLVTQTEGLVDLVVCKYNELPSKQKKDGGGGSGDDADLNGLEVFSGEDEEDDQKWLGSGSGLGAEDGAIFLGVGAVSRPSLRSLTYWMEDIYSWGQDAYGVAENPSAPARQSKRRKKSVASSALGSIPEQELKRKKDSKKLKKPDTQQEGTSPPPSLLPPPPVTQLARKTKLSTAPIPTSARSKSATASTGDATSSSLLESAEGSGALDKYMSIVKLGYGTYWGLGGGGGGSHEALSNTEDASSPSSASKRTRFRNTSRSSGRFLIPLLDTVEGERKEKTIMTEEGESVAKNEPQPETKPKPKAFPASPPRSVFVDVLATTPSDPKRPSSQNTIRDTHKDSEDKSDNLETVTRGKQNGKDGQAAKESAEVSASNPLALRSEQLRVVVYAQRPFLYTFLFKQQPDDSDDPGKVSDMKNVVQILIDRQLSVLHKPLLKSTLYRPDKPSVASGVSAILSATMAASSSASVTASAKGNIYDLIWDPGMLTIHSTIPNIPEPYSVAMISEANLQNSTQQGKRGANVKPALPVPAWSRVEALNTHMQILNMYSATRSNGAELERMCKTSRGWWIVWNRIVERAAPLHHDRDEEGDIGGSDSDDDDNVNYKRVPSDAGSDNTAAARPALGDYTVSKEIILIRRSSDHPDNAKGSSGAVGGSGSGSGLGSFSRASSAMRAFSASAYLGFGGRNDIGSDRDPTDPTSARTASPARMDVAGAEELAAVAAERNGAGGAGWADGASKIAQGIGVDTKKYIEGLLTLNR